MKKVRFVNMDPESVRFMAREINILRKLDHPNVMKLECLVTSRVSGSLYLVFEYMEHDLAGLAARPGVKFTESQVQLPIIFHLFSLSLQQKDICGNDLFASLQNLLYRGSEFERTNNLLPLILTWLR